MNKETSVSSSFGVGSRSINDPVEASRANSAPIEVPFTKKRLTMLAIAVIIISVTFGIQLAQYLSYLKNDSVSSRFGTMYEHILTTNISFIDSLIADDRPVKLPSLDNHIYFINFGQIMTHDDPNLSSKIDETIGKLRLIQENYEFLLNNLVSYEVAYSLVEPEGGTFPRNPDPILTYNGNRMRFSEYQQLKDAQIVQRKEQLTRLAALLKQYLNQYRELAGVLSINSG